MLLSLKVFFKKILPKSVIDILKSKFFFFKIKRIQIEQKKALKKVRQKNKIKVAFFLIHESIWKYEGVYRLMELDKRFEPVVVICPIIRYGEETMLYEMNKTFYSFKEKNYKTIKTFNETTQKWLDVKKEINPDIIFFTNPHKLTKDEYYITNYTDRLTCYVPYNYGNSNLYQMMHNQIFHNYLWRLFAETSFHKELSVKYAQNKGKNVYVTGFPGTDVFLDQSHIPANIWKQKDENIKKIIWAPHHTIDDNKSFLSYSSFLFYADFMVRITNEYRGKIQIAFKPHPLLYNVLENDERWGKEKTRAYYNNWNTMENGQWVDGDYTDLFLTSDALMHSSGSFLIEYLYTGKPALRIIRDENTTDRMNPFGIMAYNLHYHAKNEEEIIEFIKTVIDNTDVKKDERKLFLSSHLLPPNNKSASENIIYEISKEIEQIS